MNFYDYFKFYKKNFPHDVRNNIDWYTYLEAFSMCANISSDLTRSSANMRLNLLNIFGPNNLVIEKIPGVEFSHDELISEAVMYYLATRSHRASAKPLLYWISSNTIRKFTFRKRIPNTIYVLFYDMKITGVNYNNTIYFSLMDICNIVKNTYRDSIARIRSKDRELKEFVLNPNSVKKIYSEMMILKDYIRSSRVTIESTDFDLFYPYKDNIELDRLGDKLLGFDNFVETMKGDQYLSLPTLYKYLALSNNPNCTYLLLWLSNEEIPYLINYFNS